jgi:hypothetical protein
MNDFPVDFQTVAKGGKSTSPISSSDLMKNFAWAKLVVDSSLVDTTSVMGFSAHKFKMPAMPESGTFVLGAVNGSLSWIATEECP